MISRTNKTLILLGTILPLVWIIIFMIVIFAMIISMEKSGPGSGFGPIMMVFMCVHFLVVLLSLAILIIYIIIIAKNKQHNDTERILWIIGVVFASQIVMIVYWFLHIRHMPEPGQVNYIIED